MKKIAIATTLAFMFTSTLFAEPNLQKNPEGLKKLAQIAGETSHPIEQKRSFPKRLLFS